MVKSHHCYISKVARPHYADSCSVTASEVVLVCVPTKLFCRILSASTIVFAREIPSSDVSSLFARPQSPSSAIACALYLIINPTVTGPKMVLRTIAQIAVIKNQGWHYIGYYISISGVLSLLFMPQLRNNLTNNFGDEVRNSIVLDELVDILYVLLVSTGNVHTDE